MKMHHDLDTRRWQQLGSVPSGELREARLQLHWAAQVPAAAASALAPAAADDSHLALAWDPEGEGLWTVPLPGGMRAGLLLKTGEVAVASEGNIQRRALDGITLQEGLGRMAASTGHTGELGLPCHDMPDHGVASGQPFTLQGCAAGAAELAAWYADAALVLEHQMAPRERATPVRCWPHHFDLASLEILDPGTGVGDARSIGLGMTPGDDLLSEPYYYVLPWPRPDRKDLPALEGGGVWHAGAWLGAILTAEAIRGGGGSLAQAQQVAKFLASGHASAAALLGC